jgi:hypothetical protein
MTIKTSVIQGEVQKSVHFCRVIAATGAAIYYGNENRIGNNDRGEQDDGDYNKIFDMYFRKLGCVASAH